MRSARLRRVSRRSPLGATNNTLTRAFTVAVIVAASWAAGCDSVGSGLTPLADVLVVDVSDTSPLTVSFVTEGRPGCYVPIAHRTRAIGTTLSVEVDGLDHDAASPCRALTPSAFAVAVPMGVQGDLRLEIRHRGQTDVYDLRSGLAGWYLDPVRQSVTRLGPR